MRGSRRSPKPPRIGKSSASAPATGVSQRDHGPSARPKRDSGSQNQRPSRQGPHRPPVNEVPKGNRLIIGEHAIAEAFKINSRRIHKLMLKDGWNSSEALREIEKKARDFKVPIEIQSIVKMDVWGSHQGAAVLADETAEFDLEKSFNKERSIVVALDGVEDPHNLGAILRTSWLMGVDGVLLPADRAVGLTPIVHKVASGGVEHVPVLRANRFDQIFETLKKNGFWIFGLSHQAAKTVFDLKIPEKVAWVLGGEDRGLRITTERACDELVCLPQMDSEASYNVSVAAGMTLSETFRQHHPLKK